MSLSSTSVCVNILLELRLWTLKRLGPMHPLQCVRCTCAQFNLFNYATSLRDVCGTMVLRDVDILCLAVVGGLVRKEENKGACLIAFRA